MIDKSTKPAYVRLENKDASQNAKQSPLDSHLYSNQHSKELSQEGSGRHRRCGRWVGVMLVVSLATIICILFFLSFKLNLNMKQESWPFLGHHWSEQMTGEGQKDIPQAVLVSKYRLENSHDETSVYRNYNTGYETMKWQSEEDLGKSVCYVKKMKLNDMRNSTAITKSLNQLYKSHFYEVIAPPPEAEKGVERLMGSNAYYDCSQSRILWIEPMQYEVYVSPGKTTNSSMISEALDEDNDQLYNNNNHTRVRRSVRSCRQTCCWRVCCCDIHHFQWQVAEEFNCNHVCNRCSKRFRSVIEKLC